jgi:CubicO group peptidase (beta-lactamase class C family)
VEHRILSSEMQRAAFTPPARFADAQFRYGYGWFVTDAPPGEVIFHLGGDPGFGSLVSLSPDHGWGMSMLANFHDAWKKLRALSSRYYEILSEEL